MATQYRNTKRMDFKIDIANIGVRINTVIGISSEYNC